MPVRPRFPFLSNMLSRLLTYSTSLLRRFPRAHLPHLSRPLVRRRPPYHLHRRARRPTSSPSAQLAAYTRCYGWRSFNHRRVQFVVVGYVQGDG